MGAKRLVIWGASGHALVVADIVKLQGEHEIVGFLDDINAGSHAREFFGSTILGGREQLDLLLEQDTEWLIIGFGDCGARLKSAAVARSKGYKLAKAIHPKSIISRDVVVGDGTVVVGGAVINPGSRIGESVIVNSSATVDHECVIEDGAHISPGVHMGCRVVVGRGAWVGIGAILKDRIRIGAGSIIGAGAVVLSDIPDNVVAYGVPARVIRNLQQ